MKVRLPSGARFLFATQHNHLPESYGGEEINTHALCHALGRQGISCALLCTLHRAGGFSLRRRLAMKLTRRAFTVDGGLGYPVMRRWNAVRGAAVAAARFRPRLVIAQGEEWPQLARVFLDLGIPVLAYAHALDEVFDEPELLRRGDFGIVVNSAFLASRFPAERRPRPIPPLVEPDRYRVAPQRRVATFLNPQLGKGLDVAIRLVAARPDVPFEFVLSRHAPPADWRKVGFDPGRFANLTVTGPFRDMRPVYRRSRLVVVPSRWLETWGRVVTEAQLSGIPVLASSRGALPDTVGAGGICLDPDDPPGDWEAAFAALWDDADTYARCCAAASAHAARRDIGPGAVLGAFLDVTGALLARGGGPTAP
ncbi:MAG: glycosyltransferase [Rhodospirillales bacterium]|nr:glycosyltransferase [Rhodospirillales bacterium]